MRLRFKDGGGRGSLEASHSDVPLSILHHAAFDETSDEPGMDHECLSESDMEEALPSGPHTVMQTK